MFHDFPIHWQKLARLGCAPDSTLAEPGISMMQTPVQWFGGFMVYPTEVNDILIWKFHEVSIVMRVPQNASFPLGNPTKMDDDWGHPVFRKPPCASDITRFNGDLTGFDRIGWWTSGISWWCKPNSKCVGPTWPYWHYLKPGSRPTGTTKYWSREARNGAMILKS